MSYRTLRHPPVTRREAPRTVCGMKDPMYKRLFGFPCMVEDLLRAVGAPAWLDDVRFGTLERLSAEHVGEAGQLRRGDAVWRIRYRDGWLLVVVEFQADNDGRMALRILEYTVLLYREADRQGELGPLGGWHPVVPVVVYSGSAPWTADLEMRAMLASAPGLGPQQPAQLSLLLDEHRTREDDLPVGSLIRPVVGIERATTPAEAVRSLLAAKPRLRGEHPLLATTFVDWLRRLFGRMVGNEYAGEVRGLEDVDMALLDRASRWSDEWRREGRLEGVAEGRLAGVAEGRLAGMAEGRLAGMAEGRLAGVAEGRLAGVAEGRLAGVAEGRRQLLVEMAGSRFGPETAARVQGSLATADAGRLAAAGELLVHADSADALLAGLAALERGSS